MHWVIGDIQGCALEFDRLLRAIRFDPDKDRLWCLGDMINRGPDSLAVLQLWQDVGGASLIGNHEVYAVLAGAGTVSREGDNLDALFQSGTAGAWLHRLRALPVLAYLPPVDSRPGVWLVHAGLHPLWADLHSTAVRLNGSEHDDAWLRSTDVEFATNARCCTPAGEMSPGTGPPSECRTPYRPWNNYYLGTELVIHGHWARRGYYKERNVIGLDSGCVYGGSLTAWCQEEERIVQIRA